MLVVTFAGVLGTVSKNDLPGIPFRIDWSLMEK